MKNCTTQGQKDPCLKSPLAQFFLNIPRGIRPRGTTFEFEYFLEFESEYENNSGYESGIHMGSIHEINKRPKIYYYYPFNMKRIIFPKMIGFILV